MRTRRGPQAVRRPCSARSVGRVRLTSDPTPAPASEPRSTSASRRLGTGPAHRGPPGPRRADGQPGRRPGSSSRGCGPTRRSPRATYGRSPGSVHGLPLLPADVVDRPALGRGLRSTAWPPLTAGAQPAARRGRRPHGHRATAGLQVGGGVRPTSAAGCSASTTRSAAPQRAVGCSWSRRTWSPRSVRWTCRSTDFGLWVCLHEATHRLQFTAVPWLRDYFARRGRAVPVGRRTSRRGHPRSAAGGVSRRSGGSGGDSLAFVELLQGPEQRAVLDRLLGADDAAGGSRRPRHGRRRPGGRALGGDDPGTVHRAPPRWRGCSTGCSGTARA